MRQRFLVLTLLFSALCFSGAQGQDRAADREAITRAKVETWRSLYRNRDVEGLDKFLTDDFVIIGPDGSVTTKEEELAWLADNGWNGPSDFLYTVEDIIFISDTAALVYGHGDSTRETADGAACHHSYRSSNTMIKEGGVWRPVFSHVSGARCDPIE